MIYLWFCTYVLDKVRKDFLLTENKFRYNCIIEIFLFTQYTTIYLGMWKDYDVFLECLFLAITQLVFLGCSYLKKKKTFSRIYRVNYVSYYCLKKERDSR